MINTLIEFVFVPLHVGFLLFIGYNIFRADKSAFDWMKGKIEKLNEDTTRMYHRHVSYGLLGMIVTGIVMFIPLREKLLASNAFAIKMALVLVLIINSVVIDKHIKVATEKSFAELTTKERLPLLISGAVSTICWLSILVAVAFLPE